MLFNDSGKEIIKFKFTELSLGFFAFVLTYTVTVPLILSQLQSYVFEHVERV